MSRKKLTALFDSREQQYKRSAANIITSIPKTISGIVEFLKLTEAQDEGRLSWDTIDLVDEVDIESQTVYLVGSVTYLPGSEFYTTDGEMVSVSDESGETFSRVIRLGIPYDIVVTESKTEVMQFLARMSKENAEYTVVVSDTIADMYQDFNLKELTNEQQLNVVLSIVSEKKH